MAYDDTPDRWRIEKRISVGDILKTLLVAAGVILYVGEIEKAVLRNEGAINTVSRDLEAEKEARRAADDMMIDRLGRSERRVERTMDEIRDTLTRIEDALSDKVDKD